MPFFGKYQEEKHGREGTSKPELGLARSVPKNKHSIPLESVL